MRKQTALDIWFMIWRQRNSQEDEYCWGWKRRRTRLLWLMWSSPQKSVIMYSFTYSKFTFPTLLLCNHFDWLITSDRLLLTLYNSGQLSRRNYIRLSYCKLWSDSFNIHYQQAWVSILARIMSQMNFNELSASDQTITFQMSNPNKKKFSVGLRPHISTKLVR